MPRSAHSVNINRPVQSVAAFANNKGIKTSFTCTNPAVAAPPRTVLFSDQLNKSTYGSGICSTLKKKIKLPPYPGSNHPNFYTALCKSQEGLSRQAAAISIELKSLFFVWAMHLPISLMDEGRQEVFMKGAHLLLAALLAGGITGYSGMANANILAAGPQTGPMSPISTGALGFANASALGMGIGQASAIGRNASANAAGLGFGAANATMGATGTSSASAVGFGTGVASATGTNASASAIGIGVANASAGTTGSTGPLVVAEPCPPTVCAVAP